MELQVKGKIEKFLDVQQGTSKQGTNWKKQEFLVRTEAQYNNLYCFEVFGEDKVNNLSQYNKVGDEVTVKFNVNTSEWQGRYFTSLSAWRIEQAQAATPPVEPQTQAPKDYDPDDLPF